MRRPRFRLFVHVFVVLMLCSVMARAQMVNRPDPTAGAGSAARGNHVIRGKIFLPSGHLPEQRIRVVLELVSGGIYAETFSDSVGGFEFRSLPNNTYRILVPSDGHSFETAQENLEVSGTSSRTYTAQLYLREKERAQQTASNKMISAAEFAQEAPKAAKKSYEQGLKKLKDGKGEEALALFQESLKQFPDYVLALNRVGELQVGQKQTAEAEAAFRHAVEVSPKYPLSLINLGMLMVELQRYAEAIEPLEAALKLDESFPMAHLNLGIALLERTPKEEKDLERAERAFSKALAMGGTPLAYVHKYLFNLHVRRHDYAKAASELEAYLTEKPDAPDAAQVQEMIQKVKKAAAQPAKPN
jgi:tetratricopeptide (TPR) repeat protein